MKALDHILLLAFCLTTSIVLGQIEICDNGVDDDNDALVDLNDPDCECQVVSPYSLIPNPSFEDMNCCPQERSQLNCATDWIQASEPTTDFIHTCDWLGWDDFPPPMPFPDGEGIMGFRDGRVRNNNNGQGEPYWKEYAGACLINPLEKDSVYKFQFDVGFVSHDRSPPIDISFFGTNDCVHLPFGVGDEMFGCPANNPSWKKLGEVRVAGGSGNKWVNTSLEVIPTEDIRAIAIGPDCPPIFSDVSTYYFFDNLLLADLESFNLKISEEEHPCNDDYNMSVPFNSAFEYQWYLDGVALVGETNSRIKNNYGEGMYSVRILDGISCRVSTNFEYKIPEFEELWTELICDGDVFEFGDHDLSSEGIYIDTFKNEDNCSKIVTLDLQIIGAQYDTLEVEVLEGEEYSVEQYSFNEAGEYPLQLESSIGCDSLVLLKLTNFRVYIPNAFSPNNDGSNDIFEPLAKTGIFRSVTMRIYDRWGGLVYEGASWDGTNAGTGVYVYSIEIEFDHEISKTYKGSVTVFK